MPDEKIVLITGANKGLGLEIARQLGEQGAVVLLGARDETRGKEAADALSSSGLAAEAVRIDVTDSASVAGAAREIEQRYGRLDVLVNNAGITGSFFGPPSEATAEQLREVYDTNVFGVVTVTNAMLPLLRRSPAGRIVNMSSNVGSLALNADPDGEFWQYNMVTYQSSKTALNAVTLAYAKELHGTNIKVNAANPGFTATDMNNHRGHQSVEQGAAIAVRLATLGPDGPSGTSLDENGTVPW
ncbi:MULTISPECIES: SDR family oxidoreductase [unclassified Streptomyces]|uniref:SDR family oxidoreductase n=1 Tax=unclassified Streptomyces TaxID=2593676 RepID=UPI001BE964FC|nr:MULTISPECIES: SDR family oxidoreductase [unclassified Streptomyces]MBT2402062.1 SDR family oxidoreductase [Streptomyces sp. ISL-21]MBT2609428.1 SDR family oxidoreductase [Streptomyces sp. ISL-87]